MPEPPHPSSAVGQFPDVEIALRTTLNVADRAKPESVERLVAAGILREDTTGDVLPACDLYAQYLQTRLA